MKNSSNYCSNLSGWRLLSSSGRVTSSSKLWGLPDMSWNNKARELHDNCSIILLWRVDMQTVQRWTRSQVQVRKKWWHVSWQMPTLSGKMPIEGDCKEIGSMLLKHANKGMAWAQVYVGNKYSSHPLSSSYLHIYSGKKSYSSLRYRLISIITQLLLQSSSKPSSHFTHAR